MEFTKYLVCSKCGMFSSDSFSVDSNIRKFTCVKCQLLLSLISEHIWTRVRRRESSLLITTLGTLGEPPQQGNWVTVWRHSQKVLPPHASTSVLHPLTCQTGLPRLVNAHWETYRSLKVYRSFICHNKLAIPLGASAPATVRWILGAMALDIVGNLKMLASRSYNRMLFHVGTNDICLWQSEVTKSNINEVRQLAQTMSDAVISSVPIPVQHRLWQGLGTELPDVQVVLWKQHGFYWRLAHVWRQACFFWAGMVSTSRVRVLLSSLTA